MTEEELAVFLDAYYSIEDLNDEDDDLPWQEGYLFLLIHFITLIKTNYYENN